MTRSVNGSSRRAGRRRRDMTGTPVVPDWRLCTAGCTEQAMAEPGHPSVLMAVEQLRRRVPGGIGAYARGLLRGLAECAQSGDEVDLTLMASRVRGNREQDPLLAFGRPLILSRLPGPLLTRSW